MRFRSYDSLRLFDAVARHLSFTAAASELNRTKGAISYQIARLESELGFKVFERHYRGIVLTERGKKLWHASQMAFRELDHEIAQLRDEQAERITIGMSTYFASRWLSQRLMTFTAKHPRIGLRLQPLVDLMDLRTYNIDMAIRWGKGDWSDLQIERLFLCPAFPTAGVSIAKRVENESLETVLASSPHLHDRDASEAWLDWYQRAGFPYRSTRDDLVVPDPNVRVQAVVDDQGVALNDRLVIDELNDGRLFQISTVEMSDYGYFLACPQGPLDGPGLRQFRDWLLEEARTA